MSIFKKLKAGADALAFFCAVLFRKLHKSLHRVDFFDCKADFRVVFSDGVVN